MNWRKVLQSINGNLISNRSGAGSTVISNLVTFQGGVNVWVQNWPSSFTNGGGGSSNVWIQTGRQICSAT